METVLAGPVVALLGEGGWSITRCFDTLRMSLPHQYLCEVYGNDEIAALQASIIEALLHLLIGCKLVPYRLEVLGGGVVEHTVGRHDYPVFAMMTTVVGSQRLLELRDGVSAGLDLSVVYNTQGAP